MYRPMSLTEVIVLLVLIILVVATLVVAERIKHRRSPESNHYDFSTQAERTVTAWERNSAQIKETHK